MKSIRSILSQYFDVKENDSSIYFTCPFCKKENKQKELYIYKNSNKIICFRCRIMKRSWTSAWKFLQDVLQSIGVENTRFLTEHQSLVYEDLGTPTQVGLSFYPQRNFIPGYQSEDVKQFLIKRGHNLEKVLHFFWYGTRGDLQGRVCVPLTPSGWQGRVLTPNGKPKYKIVRGKSSDHNLYFTPLEGGVSDAIFLVESPFGAIKLYEYGYDAIAFLGINPHKNINALLRRKKVEEVYLWLDPDVPRERIQEVAKTFISEDYVLYIIEDKKEPEDTTKEEFKEALIHATEFSLEEIY